MLKDLLNRSIHDCELKHMAFSVDRSIVLTFSDPFYRKPFKVIFTGVSYFLFETDHLQNVEESIVEFSTIEEAKKDSVAGEFAKRVLLSSWREEHSSRVAYIQPITGGEGIIIFESVALEEGDGKMAR